MNIKYIILCRYNSNRLPGKILKEINGIPILTIILKRLQTKIDRNDIVIATSTEASDNPIQHYCEENDYNIYRGSLENVSERFLHCATTYNADYAVRINGDNLFTDPTLILKLVSFLEEKPFDFISNVPGRSFPFGLSVEVVSISFYQSVINIINQSEKYKEHVTLFLYENTDYMNQYLFYKNEDYPIASGIQLAVDDENDFKIVSEIVTQLGAAIYTTSWEKIVALKTQINE